ncbi:MAG: SDR family oxidoreductase [Acidimicrobiia bacterium]|nr:SDR family oxidoreductase [Acidimicrobiia bacterium]
MTPAPTAPFDSPEVGRRFAGKVAVITGAAAGIGRATAHRLAAEGATVWCCDLDEAGAQRTGEEVTRRGGQADGRGLDVTDPAAVNEVIAEVLAASGRLDVVANIAGIGGSAHTNEETPERFAAMFAVNAGGPFNLVQAALPSLLDSRGNVVNMASITGMQGQAYCAAYCASKHAVVGLTKALALEYGRQGVRFNAVCPGGVNTGILAGFMPPEGASSSLVARAFLDRELQEPESVAAMVAYVASDEASYVNGAVLSIDGGTTAG